MGKLDFPGIEAFRIVFWFVMLVIILIAMFVRYWKNRTVYYFVTFMSASHRRGWLFMSYRAVFDVKDAERMISEKTNHSVLILSYKRISKSEYKANIHAYEKGSEK